MDIKETIAHPSIEIYRQIIAHDTVDALFDANRLKKLIRVSCDDSKNKKKLLEVLNCLYYAELIFLYDDNNIIMTDQDGVRGIIAFTSQKEIKDKKLCEYEQRTKSLPELFNYAYYKLNDADALFINPFTQRFCLDLDVVFSFFGLCERTLDYAESEMAHGISGDYLTGTLFEHFTFRTVEYTDYYGRKTVGYIDGCGIDKKLGTFLLLSNEYCSGLRVYLKDVKFIRDKGYDDDDDDDDEF